jgi:hypothetical protein
MDAGHLTPPPMPDLNGTAEQGGCGLMTHAATCPACLLELSDERDAQLRARLNAWRDGYRAAVNALADLIGGRIVPDRPTELEKLRYPPDGRAGWLLPDRVQDGDQRAAGQGHDGRPLPAFRDPAQARVRSEPQ